MRKKHRGRPLTYLPAQRRRIAKLVSEHGIAGAQRRMRIKICAHTLGKIAQEYGIELAPGRRRAA